MKTDQGIRHRHFLCGNGNGNFRSITVNSCPNLCVRQHLSTQITVLQTEDRGWTNTQHGPGTVVLCLFIISERFTEENGQNW